MELNFTLVSANRKLKFLTCRPIIIDRQLKKFLRNREKHIRERERENLATYYQIVFEENHIKRTRK